MDCAAAICPASRRKRGDVTAKVLCLASAKGGSGKTLITASLATVLAALGKRVVMVDTDAATNGLSLLHLDAVVGHRAVGDVPARGLFEAVVGEQVTLVDISSGLRLLPATYAFRNSEDVPVATYAAGLRAAVAQVADDADYVFLDAQAGSDEYAQQAVALSDEVVIVTEYDPMSAAGVERLRALFGDTLGYGRSWILLNKMLPEFVTSFSEFLEVARYLSPVPWDADVVRAYARRSLAVDVENGNAHTAALMQTMRGLVGAEIGQELAAWRQQQRAAVRDPAVHQASLVGREIDSLQSQIWSLQRRRQLRSGTVVASLIFVAVSLLAVLAVGEASVPPTVFPFAALALGVLAGFGSTWMSDRQSRSVEGDRLQRRLEAMKERERRLLVVAEADADGDGPDDVLLRPSARTPL